MRRTVRIVLVVAILGAIGALLFLPSCGPAPVREVAQPVDAAYEKVKPVIDRVCLKCHNTQNPKLDTASRFKGSKAREEIEGGDMPPGGHINAADKQALLDYLKG